MKKILSILIVLSFSVADINEFEEVFNKQLQKQLRKAFEDNGFTEININQYLYQNAYEEVLFEFDQIKAVQGGVGLFSPEYRYEDRGEIVHLKFDLIKINIPINQFIDNLEQLQSGDMIQEINSFGVSVEGMNFSVIDKPREKWIEAEEYYDYNWNDRWDQGEEFLDLNNNGIWDDGYWKEATGPGQSADLSFSKLTFDYDGKVNQEIYENLENHGILPENNQVIEFSLLGLSLNTLTDENGYDLIKDIVNTTSLSDKDFRIDDLTVKFGYLPQNNKLRYRVNFSSPLFSAISEVIANVRFNYDNIALSDFGPLETNANFDLNIPYNTVIDFDKYKDLFGLGNDISFGKLTLPNNIRAQSSVSSSEILEFIFNSALDNEPNPYIFKDLLNSLRYDYDISMNGFKYNFFNTEIDRNLNVSFKELNLDNFTINSDLNNGNFLLKADIISNIFNFTFSSSLDLNSMFSYNMNTMEDLNAPYISSAEIRLSKIHSDLEPFIQELEYNIGEQFPRQYGGDIVLRISGTLDNPSIQGMNFPNQQPQRRY